MSERFERQAIEGNSPDAIAELKRQQELLQTRLAKGGQLADITGRIGGKVSIGDDGLEIDSDPDEVAAVKFFLDTPAAPHNFLGEILSKLSGTSGKIYIRALVPNTTPPPWEHASVSIQADNQSDGALIAPQLNVGSDGIVTTFSPTLALHTGQFGPYTAPTLATTAGGAVDVGTHTYGATFYDSNGETLLVAASISAPITISGGTQTVNLTDIPTGIPGTYGVTGRKIYRKNDAVGDWKLVTTIADNTTTTYSDAAADASLGAVPPSENKSGTMVVDGNTKIRDFRGRVILPLTYAWTPAAPVASQQVTAAAGIPPGTYRYKITFQNAAGHESAASPASNAVVVDASHTRTTVTLSLGPDGTTQRVIYRADAANTWVLSGIQPDNTTTAITDSYAGPGTPTTIPVESAAYLPTLSTYAKWKLYEMTCNKSLNRGNDAAQTEGEYWAQVNGTQANGDWLRTPGVVLEEGNYTVTALGVTANFRGMLDYYLDGTLVETAQEWYSGSTTYNVERSFTMAVPAGWHQLLIKVNGKHASSSSYYFGLTSVRLNWTGR